MARTDTRPQSSKPISRKVPSNPNTREGKFKLRKLDEKKPEVSTRKSSRLASSSQKPLSAAILAAADYSESAAESSSSSGSSSSSDDEEENKRSGSTPKVAIPSNDTINLKSNIPPNTSTTSSTQPIAEGYPSSTSYGEGFEILLRGVLDPKERVTGSGNWTPSGDMNHTNSSLLGFAKTPLDKFSVIGSKKSTEATKPTPKAIVTPKSSSTFHYEIPTHIQNKVVTSSSMLTLLKSYYTHPSLKKKFSYTWLEQAVKAFTLKMVQVQYECLTESHDIFIGSTVMLAKKVVNAVCDDVLLSVFAYEKQAFLLHTKDVSKCPTIISCIKSIMKTPSKTVAEPHDFSWMTEPGYQFLGFVTIHMSRPNITSFEIESFLVYQHEEKRDITNVLFQHTIAEFIQSTMCERLLQLCQLIQLHRTDVPGSFAE